MRDDNQDFIEQRRFTCALGAQRTVITIPRACPIIHAGPGCCEKSCSLLTGGSGMQLGGYIAGQTIPSTNSSEAEVVYGGEDLLHSTIEGALKVMDADLYVVLTGCTADIVGDDTPFSRWERYTPAAFSGRWRNTPIWTGTRWRT